MIKVVLTNVILKYITEIDKNRYKVSSVKLSRSVSSRLRKNSKKRSLYASNAFGLDEKEKVKASRIIRDTLDAKLIKPVDPSTAPRYMKYVPYWA